jgi:hypothetical protein
MPRADTIRRFLLFEGLTFVIAALVHFGVLMRGGEHLRAGIAESVIACALLGGWLATFVRPALTRMFGLAVQAFALLATLVGIFTIVVGVGPRTVPDVVYHVAIVGVLVWGLIVARRASAGQAARMPA